MQNITQYITTMAMADKLLEQALITKREYHAFEEKMRRKYNLHTNSIYRDNNLIDIPRKR